MLVHWKRKTPCSSTLGVNHGTHPSSRISSQRIYYLGWDRMSSVLRDALYPRALRSCRFTTDRDGHRSPVLPPGWNLPGRAPPPASGLDCGTVRRGPRQPRCAAQSGVAECLEEVPPPGAPLPLRRPPQAQERSGASARAGEAWLPQREEPGAPVAAVASPHPTWPLTVCVEQETEDR